MSEKLVKIKMLKNAGPYVTGQEVEVPETQALAMCTVRKKNNGNELEDFRVAISMKEFEERKAAPVDMGGLTLDEARALGIRNIVEIPKADLEKPFHPGFVEKKADSEAASALQSEKINEANPASKKKAS